MANMIKKILKKRRTKINTLENKVASLKDELLNAYRKIDEKDRKIFELFDIRDDLKRENKELLGELKELRERKARKSK